jgi:TM2 domain-containing membrane protein YozV
MSFDPSRSEEKSDKNYGTAVVLCGIFGVVGIHHFYIDNWLHGLLDLGLFILFIVLLMAGTGGIAYLVLAVDVAHTIYVFYKLIVGEQRDGEGRLITWR